MWRYLGLQNFHEKLAWDGEDALCMYYSWAQAHLQGLAGDTAGAKAVAGARKRQRVVEALLKRNAGDGVTAAEFEAAYKEVMAAQGVAVFPLSDAITAATRAAVAALLAKGEPKDVKAARALKAAAAAAEEGKAAAAAARAAAAGHAGEAIHPVTALLVEQMLTAPVR